MCGVMTSPESNSRCTSAVGVARSDGKRRLTCDFHINAEVEWRQSRQESEEHSISIRMSRTRVKLAISVDRMNNPAKSDHCASSCACSAEGTKK